MGGGQVRQALCPLSSICQVLARLRIMPRLPFVIVWQMLTQTLIHLGAMQWRLHVFEMQQQPELETWDGGDSFEFHSLLQVVAQFTAQCSSFSQGRSEERRVGKECRS